MLRYCLLYVFLLLCWCTECFGQSYIYPVATGASWSKNIYMQVEREDSIRLQKALKGKGAPDVRRFFNIFEKNYNTYNSYIDSVYVEKSNREWIALFLRRAHCFSNLYEENNNNLNNLREWLGEGGMSDETYEMLFIGLRHIYHETIIDLYIADTLLKALIPYYEKRNDREHLMFLYVCAGFYKHQISSMGLREERQNSKKYYEKAMALGKEFHTFQNPLNRYYYLAAFVNLTVLLTEEGYVSFEESRNLREREKAYLEKPENEEVLKKDSRLLEFRDWAMCISNARGLMTYIGHGLEDFSAFTQLYAAYTDQREAFGGDLRNLKHRYYAKLEYDDLIIDATAGRISWDNAFTKFLELLRTDKEMQSMKDIPGYRLNYICNLFTSFIFLIDQTSLDEESKKVMVNKALRDLLETISHFEHIQFPIERGQFLSALVTNHKILKFLNNEERSQLLHQVLVVDQPTTYVHVTMVAQLARIMTEKIIEKKPEYFVGVPGFKTVEEVVAKKDSLINFAGEAATYHDLGKIYMPTVINNSCRKLSSIEYKIISKHPDHSKKFFDTFPFIRKYRDVALGHHKWYDGNGGYPVSFSNRNSPLFPLINIVTLCDCMDAATENIGRNYHTPKTFENVMSEFEADSGMRYDQFLINFINSNTDLYRQLKQKVQLGRIDHYFQLFSAIRKN